MRVRAAMLAGVWGLATAATVATVAMPTVPNGWERRNIMSHSFSMLMQSSPAMIWA